jgi:hypothetical protein
MRHIALVVALLATPVLAGDRYLGAIVSAAGADTTNATTAAPFVVPFASRLDLYCTAAASICTDTSTACGVLGAANAGLPWAATTVLPTSTRPDAIVAPSVTVSSTPSAIVRIVGSGAVTCYVWVRDGNE